MASDDELLDDDEEVEPPELYRLELDGDWGLWELSEFGRQYVQAYSFYHVLIAADRGNELCLYRLRWALHAFPWRGGWSSVDFFDALVRTVPRSHLPRVRRIQYSSPGFIEITVGIMAAAGAVKSISAAYNAIHESYRRTQRAAAEHKLLKIDVRKAELSLGKMELVDELVKELRDELKLQQFERLLRGLDTAPLAELKVYLALCRRIRPLSKLQDDDKIRF